MRNRGWIVLVALSLLALVPTGAEAANGVLVNAGSALGGTNFGLQVTITDNATSTYVSSDHPNDETHLLLRWRMNLQNMTIAQGAPIVNNYFRFMHLIKSGDGAHLIFYIQRVPDTGNLHFIAWSRESSGANPAAYRFAGGFFFQSPGGNPAANQIQCEWWRATSAVANDGRLECLKTETGGSSFNTTNLDNFNTDIDQIRAGFFNFDTFTGTGTWKFDEYESYR